MAFVNAPNTVPQRQRFYQQAYRAHQRLWKINPRTPYMYTPFLILLAGSTAATMYAMGRKILGYNNWFGKE